MSFKILKKSEKSAARAGILKTLHGEIKTPFFMPIATRASVKSLTSEEIKKLGSQIILSNTYHLFLKPGLKVLKKSGGLHKFMDWPGPILTDSGGFQVFSLDAKAQRRESVKTQNDSLVKISPKGVEFKSVYDGSKHLFTPKKVLEIQKIIGSDIRMVLDVCSPAKCSKKQAEKDLAITLKWAAESIKYHARINSSPAVGLMEKNTPVKLLQKLTTNPKQRNLSSAINQPLLFGIVQGALYKGLRLKSVKELSAMNFDGYAIGGLAVGESVTEMYKVLDYTVPELPANKPHYLMGVGYPEQIVESVKRGIDMFDCVIPTREARHGRLYSFKSSIINNRSLFYKTINIKSNKFAADTSPINSKSKFIELRNYSKAYLRHLFSVKEPLALRLSTLNNLEFYLKLMKEIRLQIKENKL